MKQGKNRALYHQIKEKDQLIQQLDELAQKHTPIPQKPVNTKQQQLFDKFHAHLLYDKNFTNPDISRDDIIVALSTNRTTLSEAVKTVTNKSLMDYINYLRVDEARKMLESHSEYTMMAIALECGFNSYRTFHRIFQKTYRLKPVEYTKLAKTEREDV